MPTIAPWLTSRVRIPCCCGVVAITATSSSRPEAPSCSTPRRPRDHSLVAIWLPSKRKMIKENSLFHFHSPLPPTLYCGGSKWMLSILVKARNFVADRERRHVEVGSLERAVRFCECRRFFGS
jgi:hypothetical protein